MTATEELRKLLDERGVEWTVPDESWNQDSITYWKVGSIKWVAFESENGTLWLNCNSVTDLTPAQAIAATLSNERERELESLAADMFCWLVDYLTPAQTQAWETRLEELNVPPTWGVRS